MDEKKLTPQESMELITSMIQNTKRRVATPDLRISVMWAVLTIVTAIAAWALLSTTHNPLYNFICSPSLSSGFRQTYSWLRMTGTKA